MRNIFPVAILLLSAPAGAQDVLNNDMAMKSDVMIREGDVMIVAPDGHVTTMAATGERRTAMQAAIAVNGIEVGKPMILMLRDGKLMRMDDVKS